MRVVLFALLAACSHPRPIANATPAPATPAREIGSDDAWQLPCRQALAGAETTFRRDAPAIYPPYASLEWKAPPPGEVDENRVVQIEITPGRTWKFAAAAYTPEASGWSFPDLRAESDAWTQLPDMDAAYTREVGRLTLAIMVETERSAMPVAQHPLVVEFVKRMKTALDSCVR